MKNPFKDRLRRLAVMPVVVVTAAATMLGSFTASADSSVNQSVKTAQEGVYALELVYADKNSGKKFPIQSGTGFFINDDTLVTCNHVVTLDDDIEDDVESFAKEMFGSYSVSNLSVEVMLQSDVSVPATIITNSADADWAILQVKDAIQTTPLKIGNSDECQNTQSVYAIGYPSIVAHYSSVDNFSNKDISTTKGQISKVMTESGIDLIQHGATISAGNSGGPLVDENGAVVGVNRGGTESEDYYFAIAMEQIVNILDKRSISYERSDSSSAQPVVTTSSAEDPVTEPVVTEEPPQTVTDVSEAEPVPGKLDDSKSSKDKDDDDDKDDDKIDTKTIVLISAGAVVLILIIIIIIVAVSGKKQPAGYSQNRGSVAPPPPQQPRQPIPPQAPSQMPPPQPAPAPYQSNTVVNNAGETTVLGAGGAVGETTVLGGGAAMFGMIRKKTNEPIAINKASFVLGKDTSADYCINGNSSISRNHARITVKGGQCFITDMRSTNGTFVNGARIAPNQEAPIKSGDIIRLSDEEFEFR